MALKVAHVLMLTIVTLASVTGSLTARAQTVIRPTLGFFVDRVGVVSLDTEFAEIQVFRSLLPGQYIANATANIASSGPQFNVVQCGFTVGGLVWGQTVQGLVGGDINNFLAIPLTIGFKLNSTKNLGVACRTDVSLGVVSQPSQISVIRVDKLIVDGTRIVIP